MLGKIYGYYPEDPIEAQRVDATLQANADILDKLWQAITAKEEEKESKFTAYFSEQLPKYFEQMEARLKRLSKGKYIHGEKMTLADIHNVNTYATYFINDLNPAHKQSMEALEKHPDLLAYYKTLAEDLKEYFEKRPKRPY